MTSYHHYLEDEIVVDCLITFSVRYASDGNDNALEQSVTVTYDIAATGETGGIIPSGAIMVYRNASVTADDIDSKFICVILQELQCHD